MGIDDWFFDEIEKKRNIKIPRSFLGQEPVRELERLIKSRNATKLHLFYSKFDELIDMKSIFDISDELKKERKIIEEDKLLIQKIVKIKGNDWEYFFDIIGNITHNALLVDDLNSLENAPKSIIITIQLWAFLSFIELITKLISEYIKAYVDENVKDIKVKKGFSKSFRDDGHPEMGKLIRMLINLHIISQKKDKNCFLIKNKVIRNRIAHNNIYYDNCEDSLYFTNGEKYAIEEFQNDFIYFREFLMELIYQMNGSSIDILSTLKTSFKQIGNAFLKIERSPQLKVIFQNVLFDWEK